MKTRTLGLGIALVLIAVPALFSRAALRHDPRTTAKKLGQTLDVDGAGRLELQYKALHFNQAMFDRAKASPQFMEFLNGNVWGKMGTARVDFEIETDELKIAAGEYLFGVNMTKEDDFSLVFWKDGDKQAIPLEVEKSKRTVSHLTITLMATDYNDTFVVEARCGPYVGVADLIVPYLDPDHEHHE